MEQPQQPQAPDPVATAKAQGEMNQNAATTQQLLNMTDQVTPYGNLNYTQSGSNTFTGADGKQYTVPKFTSTTTLSPEEQKLYNLNTATQEQLGNIGLEQSGKVRGILNSPFDLSSAISTQQSDIATKLLDPVWNQRKAALDAELANAGVTLGSEAHKNAYRDFSDQRDRAYNSAALAGRSQAATEALTQRNQPLNEITALLSNSQVQMPGFTNTPQANVSAPNYEGDVANNYAGQMSGYNAKLSANGAMMGGFAGLAAAPLGGWARGGFAKPAFLT